MVNVGTRLGGLAGIAAVLTAIPAYVVGTPDTPRTADEVNSYYERASAFVALNGALPLLYVLFGLIFLGALVQVLRAASGPAGVVYVALAGGVLYLCLVAAGLATEVAYPAALVRFGDVGVVEFSRPLLALSVWFYHYAQVGAAALIFAASIAIWRTNALPRVTAFAAVLGVPPLLHLWLPLPAASSSLIWIAIVGMVMVVAPGNAPRVEEGSRPTATVRSGRPNVSAST